ncbi:hypothetical protein ACHAP8_010978 [Fusarium lateritium]
MDEIAVYEIHGGDGDGADITFSFNGEFISVSIFPSDGSSTKSTMHLGPGRPLQDHLVDVLSEASTCEDISNYQKLADEVLGVIVEAGRPLFFDLVSRPTPIRQMTLSGLLYPETTYFRLEAPDVHASIVPIDPTEANSICQVDTSR